MGNFEIVGTVSQSNTLRRLIASPEKGLKYCDVVELRFDQYMDREESLELCVKIRRYKKVLLTIRTDREGGTWTIDDEARYELFSYFAPHVDMIDIELKSDLFGKYSRADFPKDVKVIASFHDYKSTPPLTEMAKLVEQGRSWNADIIKLAVYTHSDQDIEVLRSFLSEKSICLIGMGQQGVVTRTSFPRMGSVLTYGYLDESAAPGQVSAVELSKQLS